MSIILSQNNSLEIDSLNAKSFYLLGLIHYYKGEFLLSTQNYQKALSTDYAKKNITLESALWNNIGINNEQKGNLNEALQAYLKSLKSANIEKDSVSIYQSYINIGFLYINLYEYKSAEDYLNKAINFFLKIDDNSNAALAYHNIAILNQRKRDLENALRNYNLAIKHNNLAGDEDGAFRVTIDKIMLFLDYKLNGDIKSEIETLTKMKEKSKNSYLKAMVDLNLGKYHLFVTKNFNTAEIFFKNAEKYFSQNESNAKENNTFYYLILLYGSKGEIEKEQEYLDKYTQYLMTNFNDNAAKNLAEIRTLYDLERKEIEVKMLEEKIEAISLEQKLWALVGTVFFILLLVSFFSRKKIKKQAFDLTKRNIELIEFIDRENMLLIDGRISSNNKDINENDSSDKFEILFNDVKKYIIESKCYLNPNLKLTDLAFHFGTNDKYISFAFSKGGKTNFLNFINFYRINHSKILLADQKLSIKEICNKSGFSNQPNFQRKFKELTGITPQTYRNDYFNSLKEKNTDNEN